MSELSILLITCEKYSIFAELCLYFIEKNIIQTYNCDIYYSNTVSKLNDNVKNIITNDIPDKDFTVRLYDTIKQIPSEFIFLIQEDHFYINEWMEKKNIETILKIMKMNKLDQIKMDKVAYSQPPDIENDEIYSDDDITISWAGGCDYPVSHHATIFNKQFLLNNLEASIKNNQLSPGQHEAYNFNLIPLIKNKTNDNKLLRIAYIKFINYIGKLNSVVRRGKLTSHGYKFLIDNKHIQEVKTLLTILPSTTFINNSKEQSTPSGFKYNVCASCNADTDADGSPIFLRCGTCKEVYYCNRICQKKHWKNEHKAVCKPKCGICSLEFPNTQNLVPMPVFIDGVRKMFDACASCVKQIVDRAEVEKEGKMPCELCDKMIITTDFTTPSIYKREGISYHIRACVPCIQKQEEFAQANEDTEEFKDLLKYVDKSITSAQEMFQIAQTKHTELVKEKENKKKKKKKKKN